MAKSWRPFGPSASRSSIAWRRSHLGKETWPDDDVPSVPMLVITTSSVAEAKVESARASSSAFDFVRRRKDFTPEILSSSVTPRRACQKGGFAGTARPRLFRRRVSKVDAVRYDLAPRFAPDSFLSASRPRCAPYGAISVSRLPASLRASQRLDFARQFKRGLVSRGTF